MTVIVQEWLTVLIALAVSVVPVKLAILEVEEIIHAKVSSYMKDSKTIIFNYFLQTLMNASLVLTPATEMQSVPTLKAVSYVPVTLVLLVMAFNVVSKVAIMEDGN